MQNFVKMNENIEKLDKECNALGGLFQHIVDETKVSSAMIRFDIDRYINENCHKTFLRYLLTHYIDINVILTFLGYNEFE